MSDTQQALAIEAGFLDILATTTSSDAFKAYRDLGAICTEVTEVSTDLISAIGHKSGRQDSSVERVKLGRDVLLPSDEWPEGADEDPCKKYLLRANGYVAVAGQDGLHVLFSSILDGDALDPDPVGVGYDLFRAEQAKKGEKHPPYPLRAVEKAGLIAAYDKRSVVEQSLSVEDWLYQYNGELPHLGQGTYRDRYVGATGGLFMPDVQQRLKQDDTVGVHVRRALHPLLDYPARAGKGISESWALSGLADQVIADGTLESFAGMNRRWISVTDVLQRALKLLGTGYNLN